MVVGFFMLLSSATALGLAIAWLNARRQLGEAREIGGALAAAAETARREAANLRQMLDAIPVPAWRRGPTGLLIDCNQAYAAAFGTTPALAVAQDHELAPGARPGERRHAVIDGSRRLFEIGEASCGAAGRIGFAVDRTDAEIAEAELRRHLDAHAQVLEGVGAAVAIYGPDKRLKFFNSAFASMWGLADNWLASQPSFDEVLERLREARRLPEAADFRAFKREQLRLFTSVVEPQQEFLHLPDGRSLLLSISPHPFGGLTFVHEDVTSRLALERSCNTLTRVRRTTLDHLFEGIAVYGSDGRLKLHNPAYLAIWGLSERDVGGEPHIGEILEKSRAFLDDGGDWAAIKETMIAAVTAHAPASGSVYRNDGSMLQQATVPLPDGNLLVTLLDVTDTARYERALRERNEALETAGRLKSEFIAHISQELRAPLNAVIGFADILTHQYLGDLNPRQLEYSREIVASSHRLLRLVDDIADLAAIESGRMTLETSRVELLAMLEAVLALTRERARSCEVEIELHCPPDIGAVAADERRLKQALFNLVSDAIRFTPPGGVVTVEAERRNGQLVLAVADTGSGILRPDQNRVLETFGRARRRSGPGLGLSLVRSLIELHGGTVTAEPAPGRGARISCRLPVDHRDALAERTRVAA